MKTLRLQEMLCQPGKLLKRCVADQNFTVFHESGFSDAGKCFLPSVLGKNVADFVEILR